MQILKLRREFKLSIVDKPTETRCIMFFPSKKMVKEAVYRAMDEMRFICKARNLDEIFGFATNLYEW